MRHVLPFNKVPKIFMIRLVFQVIKMLNQFSVKGDISDMISPTIIMTGKIIHYKKTSRSTYFTTLSSTRGIRSLQYQSAMYQRCHMHGTKRKDTSRYQFYEP